MFIGLSEKEKEERYEQSLMTEDRLGEGWPGKVPSSGEEEEDKEEKEGDQGVAGGGGGGGGGGIVWKISLFLRKLTGKRRE